MFSSIRSVFVLVLAGGVTWSCSGERVMTPQVTDAGPPVQGPLSKPAVSRDLTQAVVVADGAARSKWCNRGIFAFCFRTGSGLSVVGHNR